VCGLDLSLLVSATKPRYCGTSKNPIHLRLQRSAFHSLFSRGRSTLCAYACCDGNAMKDVAGRQVGGPTGSHEAFMYIYTGCGKNYPTT